MDPVTSRETYLQPDASQSSLEVLLLLPPEEEDGFGFWTRGVSGSITDPVGSPPLELPGAPQTEKNVA